MKRVVTVLVLLALQACSPTDESKVATAAPATQQAPATLAAAPSEAAASTESIPTAAKPIDEADILAEKEGQWAQSAEASTTFNNAQGSAGYAASRATGQPDVSRYSDSPNSWATRNGDSDTPDWLHVTFEQPVYARSIRVRQNAAPGAISKLELLDAAGAAHVVWEGTDTTPYAKDTIGWLIRDFDVTPYKVAAARITLHTSRVWGWNEIDAVQLVGSAGP